MITDNKKQDLIDLVDIGDKRDDDSDQQKPKNNLHEDPAASATTAENENMKIMTRYVDVQEDLVKYLRGEDIVMDLQLASGAMIQVTNEDAKEEYRPVRVMGLVENIDKAEKLIKAFIALVDVGGSSLLFKDYDDSDGYGTKYDSRASGELPGQHFRHGQRRSSFLKRPYGQRHYRSRSPYQKRPYGRIYSSSDDSDSDSDSYSSKHGGRHSSSGTSSFSLSLSHSCSLSPERPSGQRRG